MLSEWYRSKEMTGEEKASAPPPPPPAGSPQNLCFLNMVFDQPCDPFAVEVPIKVKHTVTRTKTDIEVCVTLALIAIGYVRYLWRFGVSAVPF